MPKRRKGSEDGDGDHDGHGSSNKRSSKNKVDHDVSNQDENAIPIFLKKTYRMIETCDPNICSWSADGDMFVVKNPEVFAAEIIPQYFDHNKFSSFARQLNFYGFRKIQTKPIRNEDFDKSTAKHVTFFNDKFKRGRYDLLKEIQRSTRGGGAQASLADQQREMETLRSTVANLEGRVQDLEGRWQDMAMKMEREIQAKVELAVMDLLSSRGQGGLGPGGVASAPAMQNAAAALQAQYMGMPSLPTSFGDAAILQRAERSFGSIGGRGNPGGAWDNPLLGPQVARAFSTASASSLGASAAGGKGGGGGMGGGGAGGRDGSVNSGGGGGGGGGVGGPTLAPHPKQKSLPPPPQRGGIPQAASGGLQGGLHTMSGGLRNAWEDKFFSTLMMSDGASRAASLAGLANVMNPSAAMAAAGGMGAGNVSRLAALAAAQQMQQQQQNQVMQQQQMQRAGSMGMVRGVSGGGGGGGGGGANGGKGDQSASALKRQTTAEILLEAAGELGTGAKAEQKESDDDDRDQVSI